jgi:hypothetical protein
MKNLNLKKHFFKIVLLIFGIYFTYDYFDNKKKIENLNYGINANELRNSLNIPIIKDNMSAENRHDEFFGNRWNTWRQKPKENEVLHAWKNVIPSENENFILNEEWDAFRKKESDGRIRQFNIYCKVINDTDITCKGRIFYNSEPYETSELNERGVDSILRIWNIK